MLRSLIACALAIGTAAGAQTPAPAGTGQPLPWRSALQGYRPFADQPVTAWRESNDTVGRIGGWRAYAREAAAPRTAQTPAAPAGVPETPRGHGGHQH